MDTYQALVLENIKKRTSGSYRNWVTVLNSYQTDNPFASSLKVYYRDVATITYKHHHDDLNFNIHGGKDKYNLHDDDQWEVEKITFYKDEMDRSRGHMAARYKNFLAKHYKVEVI